MCLAKSDWKLILEMINLSKKLGKVTAVDSITFEVFEDEIFAHANCMEKKRV
jgi:ABC-type branched-subunit amino acid transport system ATPase component